MLHVLGYNMLIKLMSNPLKVKPCSSWAWTRKLCSSFQRMALHYISVGLLNVVSPPHL